MSKLIQTSDKLFGHDHVFVGYYGIPYLYNKSGGIIDGIGRQHVDLYCRCNKCGEEVLVARIHVNSEGTLYGIKEK